MAIRPIVGPSGKPAYVAERQPIGAEHYNRLARWSREHRPVALGEHEEDGFHGAPFHCKGVLRITSGIRAEWCYIDPLSGYNGVTNEASPGWITATFVPSTAGRFEVTLGEPLPANPIFLAQLDSPMFQGPGPVDPVFTLTGPASFSFDQAPAAALLQRGLTWTIYIYGA